MSIISGIVGLTSSEVLALINRGGAEGTAGLYSCKTLLNEHRPVCTKEYHLTGKYLDGADNPDVWFPIVGVGTGAIVSYSSRMLKIRSGTGAISASRCVIDQTKFPITGNFAEVTCAIGGQSAGVSGERRMAIGFMPQFSAFELSNRAIFTRNSDGTWLVAWKGDERRLLDCPLGRGLQNGDICTVRLDRVEGSANIDIARFYVNGQKQFETANIPAVDVYAGVGVFNLDDQVSSTPELNISYFGCKFVP